MKISKSKQELARIISENGGWRNGFVYAAQDRDGDVFTFDGKPEMGVSREVWMPRGDTDRLCSCITIRGWHQTILSRDEYFHLYPAPDADGWIEWEGGECPVGRGTLVDVKYADNTINYGVSALTNSAHEDHVFGTCGSMTAANWGAGLPMSGIIAYRLHKPEQAKPESAHAEEAKPTIEQLAADYRNAKDYADRKQQEADAAKAVADAALGELERAGEALGLVIGITKPEPELVITDWRQLKVGDLVEITKTRDGVNIGEAATIIAIDENNEDFPVTVTFPGDKYPLEYSYERSPTTWRFIRRP